MLNVEDKITRNQFVLRDYQIPIWKALFQDKIKRLIIVLPRRAGKDYVLWNAAVEQCLMETCMVTYVLPNYGQCRRVIWDAIANNSVTFLELIPRRLIAKINSSEMKIVFINGSVLSLVSAESHHTSIRGTNPKFVVVSEAAYCVPGMIDTVTPILAANEGTLVLASTPYGLNWFWHVFEMAKEAPGWFVYFKTWADTRHIPEEQLEEEKKRMPYDLWLQEYFCDFNRGQAGAVYGYQLSQAQDQGRITTVAWEPSLLVHCVIDIGVSSGNATAMIFFQNVGDGTIIRIIDCCSFTDQGMDYVAAKIQERESRGWRMGSYFAPHDLAVREWGGGAVTRYEKARQLGINFKVLDQIDLMDSIDNCRAHFGKFWIDKDKCRPLIDALNNYYREYDEQKKIYKTKPVHNWASNYADALRYLAQSIYKTAKQKSGEEYDKMRNEALYGNRLNKLFREDPRYDKRIR